MRPPSDYIVFPLDVPDRAAARGLIERLADKVGLFKVGLELFIAEGPAVLAMVNDLAGPGRIFLDLKLHDIPATAGRALRSAASLGVRFVTVHAEALVGLGDWITQARQSGLTVLAVTVLTSLDEAALIELGYREELADPSVLVAMRAARAKESGCGGVVCSAREAEAVREMVGPEMVIVTPGIRPEWTLVEGDDQARVMTPKKAIEAGADYLVIGRPIRDADDPGRAADRVAREIEVALSPGRPE
ncbi:MAG: orotidine-5'-phosphate decarboxylase [Proteobacteria bacterium]|nr:orotidine-5'-phosphate decarboxylase [Pseudomonadota bacterium]